MLVLTNTRECLSCRYPQCKCQSSGRVHRISRGTPLASQQTRLTLLADSFAVVQEPFRAYFQVTENRHD